MYRGDHAALDSCPHAPWSLTQRGRLAAAVAAAVMFKNRRRFIRFLSQLNYWSSSTQSFQ